MNETTPREITIHKLNGLNDAIRITAEDSPGMGGANCAYKMSMVEGTPSAVAFETYICFQNGPTDTKRFNGFTNEALLAILIDRMEGFQRGPFKSEDNEHALAHMKETMGWLQKRTRERMARGVEGTHNL